MQIKLQNVNGRSYIIKIDNGVIIFDFIKLAAFRPYTAQQQANFTRFIEELAAGFIQPTLLWSKNHPPPVGSNIIIRMQDDPTLLRFATVEESSMIKIIELDIVSWVVHDVGFYWMPAPAMIG